MSDGPHVTHLLVRTRAKSLCSITIEKKERKIGYFNVVTSVNYDVAMFFSICNPQAHITTIEAPPPQLLPPFKGGHLERVWTSWLAPTSPKGKALGWFEIFDSPGLPHYDRVDHRDSDWKLIDRKITHPHAIPTSSVLTLKFPWNLDEGLWFKW